MTKRKSEMEVYEPGKETTVSVSFEGKTTKPMPIGEFTDKMEKVVAQQVDLEGNIVREQIHDRDKQTITHILTSPTASLSFTDQGWQKAIHPVDDDGAEDPDKAIPPRIFVQKRLRIRTKAMVVGAEWERLVDEFTDKSKEVMDEPQGEFTITKN